MSWGTIEPIKTLNGLLDWTTYFFNYAPAAFEVPLRPTSVKRSVPSSSSSTLRIFTDSAAPRTLLCHDMKGGYLDDKYIAGTTNNEFFHFFNWNFVDVFVYFSHYLVTIPPPHWVASAHLHGVAVLGTFISEHAEGSDVWNQILESDYECSKVARNLAKIAYFYNFDGWLVNVENAVPKRRISDMVNFLRLLTEETKRLKHGKSVVLWYDAVTAEGKLEWQNELNPMNQLFFDACDGIFLNYTWRAGNLSTSAVNAGDRKRDVYVGLDVHGRGMYGNGGFHTRRAMELARKNDMSVALFAHAWTYEKFNGEAFVELENFFWSLLVPYLYFKGPKKLPFRTSFCRGVGKKMYKNGVASGGPWWNLSLQQYQPLWVSPESAKIADETMMQIVPYAQATYPNWGDVKAQVQRLEALQSYDDDAYQGGSCLKLNNVDGFNPDFIRIFVCDFDLSLPVVIRYAYKLAPDNLISPISSSSSSDPIDQSFGMVLKLRCPLDASKNGVKVFLSSEGRVDIDTPNNKSDGDISAEPVVDRAVNSWIFKAFRVKSKNCGYQIGEIAASLGSNSSVLLGFFAVEFGRA